MTSISLKPIKTKLKAYVKSEVGKQKMSNCIDKFIEKGIKKTAAGSNVLNDSDMYEAAKKLIEVLKNTAQSHSLPASVMAHFNSLNFSDIKKAPDGSSIICVYFNDNLHRDSLQPEHYRGADNIVALLNTGYHAKSSIYGEWESQSSGSRLSTWSKKDRDGLWFIQEAIQDFQSNYGSKLNVTAVVGDDYI